MKESPPYNTEDTISLSWCLITKVIVSVTLAKVSW